MSLNDPRLYFNGCLLVADKFTEADCLWLCTTGEITASWLSLGCQTWWWPPPCKKRWACTKDPAGRLTENDGPPLPRGRGVKFRAWKWRIIMKRQDTQSAPCEWVL